MKARDFKFEKKAARIIRAANNITLATVSKEGKPWNTPIYAAFDPELQFYWTSDKDSVHSANIRNNPAVFITIQHTSRYQARHAVYFEAKAEELSRREEIMIAKKLALASKSKKPSGPKEFMGEDFRRVYRAQLIRGWTNDSEKLATGRRDFRKEIDLRRLRGML